MSLREFMLMQEAWKMKDDAEWEKVRLICMYANVQFKKPPSKLSDIVNIPSIDGIVINNMAAIIEKAMATRKMLNEKNKKPSL